VAAGVVGAPGVISTNSSQRGELAVVLTDVSVRYRIPSERIASLKEYTIRRLSGRRVKYNAFYALRHIDMEVRAGDAVGLIGKNGAGKSTLLKVIARVMTPSSGRVWVRGAISPLIELGAGFHPELTGRENLFINGAMLGFSRRRMQEKFDSIVEFAELEAFIDSPIRTYSSGMVARLGFSIVASADPDVLIVDEALSVGDEAFQKKCVARMNEFRARGVTIFFVTHAANRIRELCPTSVWIDGGHIRHVGPTDEVVDLYRQSYEADVSLNETQQMQIALPDY
jgi:ABC-type polysaccharide/polyol phosphate transport system ATPase subunit